MSTAPDPGVQAPTGDPGQVSAAASWHDGVAGFMEQTASTIEYTVRSLSGENWGGEAARSYATLAGLVGAHFRQAGMAARSAAQALRRFATELEHLQREGIQAVNQTVHWMARKEHDQMTLIGAQQAVSAAQAAVSQAQAQLARASAAPGPAAGAMMATATCVFCGRSVIRSCGWPRRSPPGRPDSPRGGRPLTLYTSLHE